MSKIAFIGLGNMGLPMAKNLVAAGHEVVGFDLSDAAKIGLQQAGGVSADTIGAAAAQADFYEGVRATILKKDGAPNWTPPQDIDAIFASLGDDELAFEGDLT